MVKYTVLLAGVRGRPAPENQIIYCNMYKSLYLYKKHKIAPLAERLRHRAKKKYIFAQVYKRSLTC